VSCGHEAFLFETISKGIQSELVFVTPGIRFIQLKQRVKFLNESLITHHRLNRLVINEVQEKHSAKEMVRNPKQKVHVCDKTFPSDELHSFNFILGELKQLFVWNRT
jgi:hypothetical protein